MPNAVRSRRLLLALAVVLLLTRPAAGRRPTIESLRATCPDEVAACEEDPDCGKEFRESFEPDAQPPSEQPSDLLMGIIRCFNANVEGHPKLPADACPSEMADDR